MSNSAIYLTSVHHTMLGGTKIKITQLDPVDGSKVDQYSLGAEIELASKASIHFVKVNAASLLLAWMDKSSKKLKVHILGSKHTSSFTVPSSDGAGDIAISLHTPDEAGSLSHFLVGYNDGTQHWAEVHHVDLQKKTIFKSFDVPKVPGKGTFSTSTIDAKVYFTRFTATDVSIISSASYEILERWTTNNSTASSSANQWKPSHATSEIVSRAGSSLAIRSAVLSSSGEWILIRNGATEWVRLEALAHARIAVWADYSTQEGLAEQVAIESHQNYIHAYIHRLRRHLKGLQKMPQWAMNIYSGMVSIITGSSQRVRDLEKSLFGFHRLIIFATGNGQVVALNTGLGGRIIWKADMTKFSEPLDWSNFSLRILPSGLIELQVDGSVHYLSATSGEYIEPAHEIKQPGADLPLAQSKPLVSYNFTTEQVVGEMREQDAGPLWTFNVPAGELIISVQSRPLEDPVASIGRMLGDRRVLYKYLNANMALIMTSHDALRILSVYLIDSVSGSILYTSSHKGVDTSRPITSTLSENWIAYSFTANHPSSDSKGPLLVVADLYESSLPNDRGPLGTVPNFSSFEVLAALGDAAKPYVISQTYLVPEEISEMSVTHTRQGVSTRQLLLALPQSKSVVGIPRSVIDPRRPVGRDPTKIEMAEGLSKYSPYLSFEPRWYLSHRRDVIGVEKIQAMPSGLESTSIVIAFGLDIFGTRVSPSHSFDKLGKDFNKIQMVGTVFALFVALVVVGPIVSIWASLFNYSSVDVR